jgi:putative ABC transport system ATP-binding protein
MVRLTNIKKSYPLGNEKLQILKGTSLTINKGELVSIMGPSGSGKSTLMNILGLLDTYDSGEFFLNDVQIKNLSSAKLAYYRNTMLGFVFQSFNLISYKTAAENVALPLSYQNVKRNERNAIALEYLDKVGIKDHANHLPNEMSGGQKQRTAIARALVTKPKLILADEPTGALDTLSSTGIMKLLKDINNTGVTMIIVTHDEEVAAQTNRIIRLRDGIIINTK